MENLNIATSVTISNNGKQTEVTETGEKQFTILVKYPDDFKGEKYFKDGDIKTRISENVVKRLVEVGIAIVITDEEAQQILAEKEAKTTTDAGSNDGTGENKKPYEKMNKDELVAEVLVRGITYADGATKADLKKLLEESDEAGYGK